MNCLYKKVSMEASLKGIRRSMLESGFTAQISSFKPRPKLLYFDAAINEKNVLSFVDIRAIHSFINPKLAKDLGILVKHIGKLINILHQEGAS